MAIFNKFSFEIETLTIQKVYVFDKFLATKEL